MWYSCILYSYDIIVIWRVNQIVFWRKSTHSQRLCACQFSGKTTKRKTNKTFNYDNIVWIGVIYLIQYTYYFRIRKHWRFWKYFFYIILTFLNKIRIFWFFIVINVVYFLVFFNGNAYFSYENKKNIFKVFLSVKIKFRISSLLNIIIVLSTDDWSKSSMIRYLCITLLRSP